MMTSDISRRRKALFAEGSDSVRPVRLERNTGWTLADSSTRPGAGGIGGRRESGYRSGGWELPARDSTASEHDDWTLHRHASVAKAKRPPASALYRIGAYRFMLANRDRWPIAAMACVLGVSRQGYYAWKKRALRNGDGAGKNWPAASAGFREVAWKVSAAEVESNLRRRGWEIPRDQVAGVLRQARIIPLDDGGWAVPDEPVRAASQGS